MTAATQRLVHGDVRLTLVITSSIMAVALEERNSDICWVDKVHCDLHSSNSSIALNHTETIMAHRTEPRRDERRRNSYLSDQNDGDGITSPVPSRGRSVACKATMQYMQNMRLNDLGAT